MYAAAQERSRRDHDCTSAETTALQRFDAYDDSVTNHQSRDRPLDRRKPGVLLEQATDGPAIQTTIALGTRRPNGGALAAIEHSKLQHGEIGGAAHDAAQCIDFADNSAFRDAANRRIAGHLADRLEGTCDDRDPRPNACGSNRRLRTGVPCADNDDVEQTFGTVERRCTHELKLYSPYSTDGSIMALAVPNGAPTLLIRRAAYERTGLNRVALDERLGLTPEEFRVEGNLVALGPVSGEESLADVVGELEELGLVYFDDFFELSGNWPSWLSLFCGAS